MVEILLLLLHVRIVLPGLRDHHHDCQRERDSVHHEELQRVVEHCRVRARLMDDREDLVYIVLDRRAVQCLFTGEHSVEVTSDRVDLTVVSDHSVRMSSLP